MTREEFVDHLSTIAGRLSDAVHGESEADVLCAAAVLLVEILEAPDAPPRLPVMDQLLPLLREMIGSFAAFELAAPAAAVLQ